VTALVDDNNSWIQHHMKQTSDKVS